ncbi:hypothetical protein GN244_ATG10151 [Phytophthora infestans]|uniref:Uncharacterized protein n=1 Tax=Phytophthora infestans TaxID=4787 RepID=A0A833TAS8_PHYIN|nr:hypothetical protein GN244_ATG10151 [Phytophthora infestans]
MSPTFIRPKYNVGKPRVSEGETRSEQGATTHPTGKYAVCTDTKSATSPEDYKKITFSCPASVTVRQCAVLGTQYFEIGKGCACEYRMRARHLQRRVLWLVSVPELCTFAESALVTRDALITHDG